MKDTNRKDPKDFPLTWERANSVGFWFREIKGYLKSNILGDEPNEIKLKVFRGLDQAHKRAARLVHDNGPSANYQDDRKQLNYFLDLLPQPNGLTLMEYLWRQLYVLWSDPNFWELLRSATDDVEGLEKVSDWIEAEYRLQILFPPGFWLKLLERRLIREYLFQTMRGSARFFVSYKTKDAKGEIEDFRLAVKDGTIDGLIQYSIAHPSEDMQDRWAWAFVELDEELVQKLEESVKKMLKAIRWIKKNPLEIPAGTVSLSKGRPKDVGAARLREQMVQILRDQPDISDAQLAKMVAKDGKFPQRHIAADARKLAKFRDQIPVVFHSPGA